MLCLPHSQPLSLFSTEHPPQPHPSHVDTYSLSLSFSLCLCISFTESVCLPFSFAGARRRVSLSLWTLASYRVLQTFAPRLLIRWSVFTASFRGNNEFAHSIIQKLHRRFAPVAFLSRVPASKPLVSFARSFSLIWTFVRSILRGKITIKTTISDLVKLVE